VKVKNADGTILRLIKMKNPWKQQDNGPKSLYTG
jgi:hypothetical protein